MSSSKTGIQITRRDLIKAQAAMTAAAVAGMSITANATNLIASSADNQLKWSKAPCRFCGTGCGVSVATRNGRVVATHGDVEAPVNKASLHQNSQQVP